MTRRDRASTLAHTNGVSIEVRRGLTRSGGDREWLESVDVVSTRTGANGCRHLTGVGDYAQDLGVRRSGIDTHTQNSSPRKSGSHGRPELERLATALVRWNAVAIVLQANAQSTELGGHIASYQSAETLYEVGFNHFWRARTDEQLEDLVYIQGHSSPGIYARSFVEGRLTEEQLLGFRQEVDGGGLSSYPHPWLMPDFWQFPVVDVSRPLIAI